MTDAGLDSDDVDSFYEWEEADMSMTETSFKRMTLETSPDKNVLNHVKDFEKSERYSIDFDCNRSPWDRLSDWIQCICVVTFDLELGQAVEAVYPEGVELSEQEKINYCYLAFPDSNSGCMGDTQFFFRVRHKPPIPDEKSPLSSNKLTRRSPLYYLSKLHTYYNQNCLPTLSIDPMFMWGFVYFRQVKDKSLKRGYFQKSVVVTTKLPFPDFFSKLCGVIAPYYFDDRNPDLHAICREIDGWPAPLPGQTISLGILGTSIQLTIPASNGINRIGTPILSAESPSGTPNSDMSPPSSILSLSMCRTMIARVEPSLFQPLCSLLPYIHLLWELMLTGEPVVVMASSPDACSRLVVALVSLISPLTYCSDYRPFFTIHDTEFKEYTSKTQSPPSITLGVTNPFFSKALSHWPNVIKVADFVGDVSDPTSRLKKVLNLKQLESKPGVCTHYKPYLKRDKAFIKKLLKGVQMGRPAEVQDALLRRHFIELTQSFVIPLERYMAKLMPLQKSVTAFKAVPVLRPFSKEAFLTSLEDHGPQLTSGVKGDWIGLYEKFLKSQNFAGWLSNRHEDMTRKLQALQLEAFCQTDLLLWSHGKKEVELVDMVLKIKEKLQRCDCPVNPIPLCDEVRAKLRYQLESLVSSLPEDLKLVLSTS
ncbi:protein DENND6A-like [Artemia franciscana]|uniref:protein DENND6A-like n=1 Tax=Artemia franciscana TaxID=6661 RepID=UPI0032DA27D5